MEEIERIKNEKENKENGAPNVIDIAEKINLNEDYLYDVIN